MWPGKFSPKSRARASFLDHLEELRQRLLVFLAAVGIFSIAAYFFSSHLLNFFALPLVQIREAELYFQAPYEAFLTHLKIALLTGLLAASPVFFIELWLFIAPGLYRNEQRVFLPLVLVSILLFLLGAAFAFWILVPAGLRFFLSFQTESLRPLLGVGPYFSFLIGMILASGVAFDLPVVVLGLVRAKILRAETLQNARKGMIVFILILTAVLTPSPDPVGQILLALPLLLLYEVCIRIAKVIERKDNENSLRRG